MRYQQLIAEARRNTPPPPPTYNTTGHQLTDLWNTLGNGSSYLTVPIHIYLESDITLADPEKYKQFYSLLNSASVHDQMTFLLALNKQQKYPQTSRSQTTPGTYDLARSLDDVYRQWGNRRRLDPITQKMTFINSISDQLLITLAQADIKRTWMAVLYPVGWKYGQDVNVESSYIDSYDNTYYVVKHQKRSQIRISGSVQLAVAKSVINTHDRNFQVVVLATAIYLYKERNQQHLVQLISSMVAQDPTLKRFFTNPINYLRDTYSNEKAVIDVVRNYFKAGGGVAPSEKQQMDLVTADGMKIEQLYKKEIYPSDEVKRQALASSEGHAIDIMVKYNDSSPELEELAERIQEFHRSHT
jgi:hypothetical protein